MSRAIHKMRGSAKIRIVGSTAGNISSVPGSTHSLGNIDVGSSSSDKNVILLITWADGATRTINSVTVGGVSLAQKAAIGSGSGPVEPVGAAIWAGDISGINGVKAISVNFTGEVDSVGADGVALSGLKSLTPTMTDTDANTSGAELTVVNLEALAGGISVACGGVQNRSTTISWGLLTERSDLQTGADAKDHRHSAAWDLGARVASNETFNSSSSDERAVAGAGFR